MCISLVLLYNLSQCTVNTISNLGIYVVYISLRRVNLYEYDKRMDIKQVWFFGGRSPWKVTFGRPNKTETGKEH